MQVCRQGKQKDIWQSRHWLYSKSDNQEKDPRDARRISHSNGWHDC